MRTLTFIFKDKTGCGAPLDCGCGGVYIHLKPLASLAVRTSASAPGANLIYGTIVNPPTNLGDTDADCYNEWQYSIEIDETQLVNENEVITVCDVEEICCEDCATKVSVKILEAAMSSVFTDDTIDGDGQIGTPLSVNISDDAGNDLTTGSDGGLFIEADNLPITSDDTLDGDGTIASPLSVNISGDAGNDLTTGTDGGLFVDADDLAITVCAALDGDGTVASPLCISPSADANNALIAGTDSKLYVPVETDNSATDTNSIDLTLSGTANRNIQADVIVDGVTGDNSFSVNANGIYVPASYSGVESDIDSGALGPLDISGAATYDVGNSISITVTNPSANRNLAALFVGGCNVQCDLLTVGIWQLHLQQQIDGGGWSTFAVATYGAYGATASIPMHIQAQHEDTVPAGGSLQVERRIQIVTTNASGASSLANNWSIDLRCLWTTI